MNESAWTVTTIVASFTMASWAAILALAEESPKVTRALVIDIAAESSSTHAHRAIHVGRLCLLLLSAASAAQALHWWDRPALDATGVTVIALGFLYMVADALPRAVSALAPDLAAAAVPLAARTASAFRPLLALVSRVERIVHAWLPKGRVTSKRTGESGQRDLLMGVFSLGDSTVADIMTPRLDVVALDHKAEWAEVVETVRRGEHARTPVYIDNLDNIAGVLYAKDLVPAVGGAEPQPERWQDLIRPPQFVPESKTLELQLRDFQRGSSHLAVVVDEFGGTAGLVTLEDVLEEVVGEIHDEYDVDEGPPIEREGHDKFWVDGGVTLDELSAVLETNIEIDDVSTVGGLVYAELGRVPNPGDEFRLGPFRVVVERVIRRRVHRVYFEHLTEPHDNDGAEKDSLT